MIVPPTLLSGWGFPLLQRVVQTDLRFVGRRVGALLAANIVGSTLGALMRPTKLRLAGVGRVFLGLNELR